MSNLKDRLQIDWRDKQPSISDAAEKIVKMEEFQKLAISARENLSYHGPINLLSLDVRVDKVRLTPGFYKVNIFPTQDRNELKLVLVYSTDLKQNPTGFSGIEYAKGDISFT